MTAYSASSYLWLGDHVRALRHAEEAVRVHERAPEAARSPSREAIARLDLAIALACLGSPDEAVVVGSHALESPRVVTSVRARAADLSAVLAYRYPGTNPAEEFRERLAAA